MKEINYAKIRDGWTTAHIEALHRRLPADFDQWALCNKTGFTVAHVAAITGDLPANFDQWELTDQLGRSVKDIYDEFRS